MTDAGTKTQIPGLVDANPMEVGGRRTGLSDAEKVRKNEMLREWRDKLLDSAKFIAVALTLLVSLTFAAFLNPPGGLTDDGKFRSTKGWAVRMFIIGDCFSFFLAVGALLLTLSLATPSQQDFKSPNLEDIEYANGALTASVDAMATLLYLVNSFFILSLCFCIAALIASGYIMTSQIHERNPFLWAAYMGLCFLLPLLCSHSNKIVLLIWKSEEGFGKQIKRVFNVVLFYNPSALDGLLYPLPS